MSESPAERSERLRIAGKASAESLTPAERSLRGRHAAHVRWSQNDSAEHAARMRAALEQRFVDEVDPDRVLPEAERLRRAGHARKAYYTRLQFLAAKARRAKAEARRAEAEGAA